MANIGKFIDRNPNLQSAGKVFPIKETVGDSLKMYSDEEAAFGILNTKCKKELQNFKINNDLGYSQFLPSESVKDLLSPELKKTRFIAFREKFSENMFFKKPELGQVYPSQSKPEEFTNENFTYGLRNPEADKAYDLILPRKSAQQVKQEFMKWHDKYLISHKDYWPAERIKRNYNDNFKLEAIYGVSNNVDKSGKMVKKCLQQCDRLVVINKAQKNFLDRTAGRLGEKIDRYNLNLDPLQTFGIQSKNSTNYDVRSLIENVEPCEKNTKISEALNYINKLRRNIFNRTNFHMYDLKILLNEYDKQKTGFIPFESIMKALRSLQIYAQEEQIRLAIREFDIDHNKGTEELVNVEKFWKMLHLQYPLPRKAVIRKLPDGWKEHKYTIYRLLCSDRDKTLSTAESPMKSYKQTNDDLCRASDLISPDIPLLYGLVPRDFEILRSKQELMRIFKRLLTTSDFEKVWLFAWQEKCGEASCKMSVNEFRSFMEKFNKENLK